MSAIETFSFCGYVLRPATPSDLDLAQLWTLADVYHKEITPPTFWIEQKPGRDSFLLIDAIGPVFFFKLQITTWRGSAMKPNRAELHVQFMPCVNDSDRERTREGLLQGMRWLEGALRESGIKEVKFDSHTPELSAFCRKRLGFDLNGSQLTKTL